MQFKIPRNIQFNWISVRTWYSPGINNASWVFQTWADTGNSDYRLSKYYPYVSKFCRNLRCYWLFALPTKTAQQQFFLKIFFYCYFIRLPFFSSFSYSIFHIGTLNVRIHLNNDNDIILKFGTIEWRYQNTISNWITNLLNLMFRNVYGNPGW